MKPKKRSASTTLHGLTKQTLTKPPATTTPPLFFRGRREQKTEFPPCTQQEPEIKNGPREKPEDHRNAKFRAQERTGGSCSKRRDPTELERLLWATAITAALIAWSRAAGARQSLVEGAKKPSSSFAAGAAGAAGAAAPLPADS